MSRATFSDFNFTANTSSASPVLLLNMAMQRHSPTATIYVRRTDLDGQLQYLTYTLTDVTVGKVQDSNPSSPGLPVEGFSLRYGSDRHRISRHQSGRHARTADLGVLGRRASGCLLMRSKH